MSDWTFLRFEYRRARLQHGWVKSLRIALAKLREPIPF